MFDKESSSRARHPSRCAVVVLPENVRLAIAIEVGRVPEHLDRSKAATAAAEGSERGNL